MKKNNAFTLIEVLVVIAILAGLVAILYPNFLDVRQKTRDTQRKNDLKQIQKALELYKEMKTPPSYPDALPNPCAAFVDPNDGTKTLMAKMPGDPQGTCLNLKPYDYRKSDSLTYFLRACLESPFDPDGTSDIVPYWNPNPPGYPCVSGKFYIIYAP